MASELVKLRDAVCLCINEHVQPYLNACGSDFEVNSTAELTKRSTRACCAYSPSYSTCKENTFHISVFGCSRNFLLDESLADCRFGKKKELRATHSDYEIAVETIGSLCGKNVDPYCLDATNITLADKYETLHSAIEELLFCKRSIRVHELEFVQQISPVSLGWDERFLSDKNVFFNQTIFTYRLIQCCDNG